jgi:hypothetical protein
LICPFCNNILNDPRILPCCSACNDCIKDQSDADQVLECPKCKKRHTPEDKEAGFYPNDALLKLIETRASDVYRGKQVESLKPKLSEIKKLIDEFKFEIDNRTDRVHELCIKLRNQVHSQTEILIEQMSIQLNV